MNDRSLNPSCLKPIANPLCGTLLRCTAASLVTLFATQALAQWPQFGGPNRDFTSPATGLATQWPADGPKKLWSRELGDGYSGIAVDDGVLYTLYNKDTKETVAALDAQSGKTLWEHAYAVTLFPKMDPSFGPGPRSTPLVDGDRVYTVGLTGVLHALDRKTGKPVWSHDLVKEFDASQPMWGYAPSPLAYGNTVIVAVGGKGHGLMAFNKSDGVVAWSGGDAPNAYSSPILIKVDGQEQLVLFNAKGVMGINPDGGAELWSHPHKTDWDVNATLPVWCGDNRLFISSAYGSGSRLLQLKRSGDKTEVKELWHQPKMKVHFGSAIRIGDHIYGSSGDNTAVFFAAVNLKTGEMAFRERDKIAKAQFVYADGKLVIVDEDGNIAIATASPEGLTILAKARLLDKISWTSPTLCGTKAYLRDRKSIMAIDLG